MDHTKKLQFIENMTTHALNHMKSSPNVPTPNGKMSHDKILAFLAAQTKHGLKYFDAGGVALNGPSSAGNVPAAAQPQGLMGGISNILGTNNNFQASSADIQKGTNAAQLNNSYNGVQDALGLQKNALGQQQGLTNTLTGQANQGVESQNNLTKMLTDRANGAGPNPAQAALNQNTGQNIAQQAALMAGQRGAGANAGLIARQNAQQGAATQQQAVGQGATMEAQQQIAAQGQLQNLAGTQVGQGQGAVNALTGASNAYGQAQQNEQGILQNANTSANNAAVAMQSNINNVNSGVSAGNQSQNNNILGGIAGAVSGVTAMNAAAGAAPLAHGGSVKKYADGGWSNNTIASSGPQIEATQRPDFKQTDLSKVGKDLGSNVKKDIEAHQEKESNSPQTDENFKMPEMGSQFAGNTPTLGVLPASPAGPGLGVDTNLGKPSFVGSYLSSPMMAKGGKVPAMVSPGEGYLSPDKVKRVLAGADPMKLAEMIPGKAKKKDDSFENDTVRKDLDEGGVIIPRRITRHRMAPEKAAAFVHREAAKKRLHK